MMKLNRNLFCTNCFILIAMSCYAQKKTQDKFVAILDKWYDGGVTLSDTSLTGLIRYNYLEGKVVYKSEEKSTDFETLRANDVVEFHFFDDIKDQQRVFKVIPFDVRQNQNLVPLFFEVLQELDHFALLSLLSDLESSRRVEHTRYSGPRQVRYLQQLETLYIFDDKGSILPLMTVNTREKIGYRSIKVKERMINSGLIRLYTGDTFHQLEDYAKKNSLSFKKKEGLLAILDFYDKLEKEKAEKMK